MYWAFNIANSTLSTINVFRILTNFWHFLIKQHFNSGLNLETAVPALILSFQGISFDAVAKFFIDGLDEGTEHPVQGHRRTGEMERCGCVTRWTSCLSEGATGQEESRDGQQRQRQTSAPEAGQAGGQLAGKSSAEKALRFLLDPKLSSSQQCVLTAKGSWAGPASSASSARGEEGRGGKERGGELPFPPAHPSDIPVLQPGLGSHDKGDLDFLERILPRQAEVKKGLEHLTPGRRFCKLGLLSLESRKLRGTLSINT